MNEGARCRWSRRVICRLRSQEWGERSEVMGMRTSVVAAARPIVVAPIEVRDLRGGKSKLY
jgi:hypothetical protein